MAQLLRTWAVAAAVLALTMAAVVWWLGGPAGLGAGDTHQPPVGAAAATAGAQVQPSPAQGADNSFFARRRAITADGPAAAQDMAQLDREEQHWNQRLDQYSQARAQQGEGPGLQQLRQQLFSPEEQQRIDAALALRRLNAGSSGS